MNKTELVALMAEEAGLSKKDAEKALNAFISGVQNAVKAGDKVSLIGFGTFEDDKLVFDDILGSGMKLTFAKEGER